MYELIISADTNDADYITKTSEVTWDDLVELQPIINAIKERKEVMAKIANMWPRHTWCTSEYGHDDPPDVMYPDLTEEQIERFNRYVPYGDYGVHTIEYVVYYPLPQKVRLL